MQAHLVLAADPTFYQRSDGSVTVVEQSKNIFGNRVVDVRRYPNQDSAYQNEYRTEVAIAALALAGIGALVSSLFEPSKPGTIVSPEPASKINLVSSQQVQVQPEPKPVTELMSKPTSRDAWRLDLQVRKEVSDARFAKLDEKYRSTIPEKEIETFNAEVRAAEFEREQLANEINNFKLGREAPTQYR